MTREVQHMDPMGRGQRGRQRREDAAMQTPSMQQGHIRTGPAD
jgi:hypothetical protein